MLFKDSLQARQLWRIVQIFNEIRLVLRSEMQSASLTSGEEINPKEVIKHSAFLVAHIVFIKFQYIDSVELRLSHNHVNQVRGLAVSVMQNVVSEYKRQQWGKSPSSVFNNSGDVKSLKNAVMAALANA